MPRSSSTATSGRQKRSTAGKSPARLDTSHTPSRTATAARAPSTQERRALNPGAVLLAAAAASSPPRSTQKTSSPGARSPAPADSSKWDDDQKLAFFRACYESQESGMDGKIVWSDVCKKMNVPCENSNGKLAQMWKRWSAREVGAGKKHATVELKLLDWEAAAAKKRTEQTNHALFAQVLQEAARSGPMDLGSLSPASAAGGTTAGASPRASPRPRAQPLQKKKQVMNRFNIMGSPEGPGKKDGVSQVFSEKKKMTLCHRALEMIDRTFNAQLAAWRSSEDYLVRAPELSVYSGGCERGEKKGGLHVQLTFECWGNADVTSRTRRARVVEQMQTLVDSLIDKGKGETFKLKSTECTDYAVPRASGGWLYQLAYCHKDFGQAWCQVVKGTVTEEEARALEKLTEHELFSLDTCWAEAQQVFRKLVLQGKGAASKKVMPKLAAQIRGKNHMVVAMIEKNGAPMMLLSFQIDQAIGWLELDPITVIILMLATGCYSLGSSWIASAHGGHLDQVRFGSYMLTHSNGLLASARTHLCKILFDDNNDDHVMRLFRRTRNRLLPPLDLLTEMNLDELKALSTNNLTLPPRLTIRQTFEENPTAPQVLVLNAGRSLDARAYPNEPTSAAVLALLKATGVNMNINDVSMDLLTDGGDTNGTFTTAFVHEALLLAAQRGLLKIKAADFHPLFTKGLETAADAVCMGRPPEPPARRMDHVLKNHLLKSAPVPEGLKYTITYDSTLADVERACSLLDSGEDELAVLIFRMRIGPFTAQAGDEDGTVSAVGRLGDHVHVNAAFQQEVDDDLLPPPSWSSPSSPPLAPLQPVVDDTGPTTPGPGAAPRGSNFPGRPATPLAAGAAPAGATPLAVGATAAGATPLGPQHRPGTPAADHFFAFLIWPEAASHKYITPDDTDESSMWASVASCASCEEARQILLKHAPGEYFRNGANIMKNKQAQLAASRPTSTIPHYPLSSFRHPPLDLSKSVLLCGAAGIGKTQYARAHFKNPYVMKTLDRLQTIPGNCDGLIFDDMRFDKDGLGISPEELIALLDITCETSIKCRHYDGLIPALPRIFTSNMEGATIFPRGANAEQQNGIDRRFHMPLPYLTSPVFSDPVTIAEWENTWRKTAKEF